MTSINIFNYVIHFKRFWLYLWVITLIVFSFEVLFYSTYQEINTNDFLSKFFLLNILIGVIAFIIMVSPSKKIKDKKDKQSLIRFSIPFYLLYLIISPAIFALEGNNIKQQTNQTNINIPTPTIIPTKTITTPTTKPGVGTVTNTNTAGSKINCTGPDGKTFLTTQAECTKFNQDWGNTKTTTNTNTTTTNNGMVNCWQKRNDGSFVYNFGTISKSECDAQYKALSDSLSHFRDPVKGSDIISCSYPNEYDFGKITYDQCKAKVAIYYKEKASVNNNSPTIGIQNPTSTPVVSQKTKAQCQEEVRLKYEALQSQYGGGSGLEAINQNYNSEMNACNQYQ